MSEKELSALVSMIDEPNEVVFATIRKKIEDYGPAAIPLLEDAWMNAFSDEQSGRLEELIDDIRFNDLSHELLNWKDKHQEDLLQAFALLTRFRFPDFDGARYMEQVERLKRDAWLEMNDELTALEKTKVLNHIFYDVWGFRGLSPRRKISLNSYFLNELMDTKKGNALSLGILYTVVAQSLNIPVFGVDLPMHFVLAYMDDIIPVKPAGSYGKDEVLFYLNAMNKGAIFTANEIDQFVKRLKTDMREEFYLPINNLGVVRRLLRELAAVYKNEGEQGKTDELQKLLAAID